MTGNVISDDRVSEQHNIIIIIIMLVMMMAGGRLQLTQSVVNVSNELDTSTVVISTNQ